MDVRIAYGGQQQARFAKPPAQAPIPATGPAPALPPAATDQLSLAPINSGGRASKASRVVLDLQEETAQGFRRTRQFEQPDGRRFTRSEELSLTDSGTRRTIIQQNPSGSFTRYEEILERRAERPDDFRRIQRFQDESGETKIQINENYSVRDPFVLSGGALPYIPEAANNASFQPGRGAWLDLSA